MNPTTEELIKGCGQWKKRHCDDFGMTLCGAKGRLCLECESRLQGRLDELEKSKEELLELEIELRKSRKEVAGLSFFTVKINELLNKKEEQINKIKAVLS